MSEGSWSLYYRVNKLKVPDAFLLTNNIIISVNLSIVRRKTFIQAYSKWLNAFVCARKTTAGIFAD